jgi:hypothetical protein
LWQQVRRISDQDYVANQAKANRNWASQNADYWRRYRASHPDYTADNRAKQAARNQRRRTLPIAKEDACNTAPTLRAGTYELREVDAHGVAKKNVWRVDIRILVSARTAP